VSKFRSTASVGAEAPRFYSVAQVAQMLGMSTMTVYRAIRDGEFPAVRVRGRLIVPAKAVEAMGDATVAARSIEGASGSTSVAVTLP
jgi:excisionase family DNA binding protein